METLVAQRQKVFLPRLCLTIVMSAAFVPVIGLLLAASWFAAVFLFQIIEYRLEKSRVQKGVAATDLAVCTNFFMKACVVDSVALFPPIHNNAAFILAAVLLLCGSMLIDVIATRGNAKALLATSVPNVGCLWMMPVMAWRFGLPADELLTAGFLTVIFPLLVLSVAGELRRALESESSALIQARDGQKAAEAALDSKARFIALVSHELRTPLSAIIAGATVVSRGSGNEAQHGGMIADAGEMMRTLLNDLLDQAKLDSGKFEVAHEAVPFRHLLFQTARFWKAEMRRKGLRLVLVGARSAPETIMADPTRLRQILNNLLSNAAKFTTEGRVCILVDVTPSELAITIEDTGSGISKEQADQLFTPYMQLQSGSGGTGLGLSISRNLAQLLGGDLTLKSEPGIGSAFTLRIPLGVCAEKPLEADALVPAELFAPVRVLAVDDHAFNRQALSIILSSADVEHEVVSSGAEALERLASSAFDVILTDLHMPEMSGFELVKAIRRGASSAAGLRVIAVTGAVDDESLHRMVDAGFDGVVEKPINPLSLMRALMPDVPSLSLGTREAA